jgi:hypothetical protein
MFVCVAQDMIDGYLRPMRSHDWDRGMLLSMRSWSSPEAFPYEVVSVPVQIIIGEDDAFLLKTAVKVGQQAGHQPVLSTLEHTSLF